MKIKSPYMKDEGVELAELADDGKCKWARCLGVCGDLDESEGALLCSLPAGHEPKIITTDDGQKFEVNHSMGDGVSFVLPGHEFHRRTAAGPAFVPSPEALDLFMTSGVMPEIPPAWERCSCGVKILEHGVCEHIQNRGRSSFTATDYGFLVTFEDGCTTKIEIVKED